MYQGQTRYGFPADVYLDASRMKAVDLQMDQVRRVVGRYTHLLADAFRPVFGNLNGRDIGADLPLLRNLGIKVALLGHGGEIRHPLKHMERHEFSHYRDAPEGVIDTLLPLAERNHRVAQASGLPLFVTTPDLLDDVPWAQWAPLVVDVDAWRCDRPVMERERPVMLHAPSARWTKGTERIMPVLEDLDRTGTIELRLVEKLPWAEMRAMVQDADVVIDQFTTGAYGTLSCEAMAAGRPVIAYLSDTVKEIVGPELPIVSATPATLRSVLTELRDDRGRTAKIGLDSAHFAHKYHSGARTADVLAQFLA
jgi:glycosyltransferase involved in cell wall biosynthesis